MSSYNALFKTVVKSFSLYQEVLVNFLILKLNTKDKISQNKSTLSVQRLTIAEV